MTTSERPAAVAGRTARGVPGRRRAPVGWVLRTALRRARVQWRLLAVVAAVGLLVASLVATLTLLVAATEGPAVRAALADAPADRTDVVLRVDRPRGSAADVRAAADATLRRLLGADATSALQAVSLPVEVLREGRRPAIAHLAELDGVAAQAELVEGAWPDGVADPADGDGEGAAAPATDPVPAAIPAAAAEALGVAVGDVVPVAGVSPGAVATEVEAGPWEVRVVGVYEPTSRRAAFWAVDPLRGAGHVADFIVPGTAGVQRTDAVGPFVVAPGTGAALGLPLDQARLRYAPDFGGGRVVALAALQGRLADAAVDVPRELAQAGRSVQVTTDLGRFVGEITTAVLVTRAGLTVAGLLLLLLAVAALAQTARLLADARAAEHDLMRARGASNRQVVGATAVEAAVVALVAGAGGPLLAPSVLRGLLALHRAVPADAAAPGATAAAPAPDAVLPVDPGVPALTWVTGAVVGLVLAVVLVAPLLRAPDTFVEGQQARGRDRRAMLARSGFDVLVVALAVVAYAQLRAYRSPLTGSGAAMRVDPVLVVGPAVVLLAGALLCVRLLPPAARLTERLAARGRGLVGPLAAWEIGRRSSRATAAVLLLSLALAVSTFSQAFLATWQRSQADQAAFAAGAPVRVADDPEATARQVTLLAADGVGRAQPAIRATAREGSVGEYDPLVGAGLRSFAGRPAEVLALTPEARAMLDRGWTGEEGGAVVAAMPTAPGGGTGLDLGDDVIGLSYVLAAESGTNPLPRAGVTLRLMVRDGSGVITVLDGGSVEVDGPPRRVDLLLDGATARPGAAADAAARQYPLELVGYQVLLAADYSTAEASRGTRYGVTVTLGDLAALRPGEEAGDDPVRDPLDDVRTPGWSSAPVNADVLPAGDVPAGTLGVRLAGDVFALTVTPASVTETAWPPVQPSPAVLTRALAARLGAEVGSTVHVAAAGAVLAVEVAGVVEHVPTTGGGDAVVVDHDALARAVAQTGALGTPVDEWWVDVPDDRLDAWLAGLPADADGAPGEHRAVARARLVTELRDHPLRVATPMALWLVTAGAGLVAAVGFAVHAAVTLRSRELELAQLRAVGLQRRRVVAVIAIESLLMSGLGALFGVGVGAALGYLVGPLVAVSADGTPPLPDVLVVVPWPQVLAVVGGLVALVAVVVGVVARAQRVADPADVLRSERAR